MSGGLLLKLAQQAAENYVRRKALTAAPWPLPSDLANQRACYVSIFENPGRNLQSMFGRPLPQQRSLADEVIFNTIEAVRHRRQGLFRPVDLSYLTYAVTVLGPLERITSSAHLNPDSFGLYIRSDREKFAIILPQRTGIETPADQIATALRELDINDAQEAVTMYRFPVTYYE